MDSKYVDDLKRAASTLQVAGYPVSAEACRVGAKRMKLMEEFIKAAEIKPVEEQLSPLTAATIPAGPQVEATPEPEVDTNEIIKAYESKND